MAKQRRWHGATRVAYRVGRFVVKTPRVLRLSPDGAYSACSSWWQLFLNGLQGNLQERYWWAMTRGDARLCPVLFADPIGLVVVMPFAEPLARSEADEFGRATLPRETFDGLPYDPHVTNLGRLNGALVLRDYGS